MPSLTVTEKAHWKSRLEERLNKRIEAIWAEDPGLKERLADEARQRALVSLGVAELQAIHDRTDKEIATLQEQQYELIKLMLVALGGTPTAANSYNSEYELSQRLEAAIKRRKQVIMEELLQQSDQGRRILALENEKANLLDTVWIATSPAQIRTLWTKLAEILSDEPTPLQREALTIPPVTD
jgi:hypothetical protein